MLCLGKYFIEERIERGRVSRIPISPFSRRDYAELEDILDFFHIEHQIQTTFDEEIEKIENVRPGIEASSIGQLSVLFEGDTFPLEDLATIATSRNVAKASVAGCPELVQPIMHGKNTIII